MVHRREEWGVTAKEHGGFFGGGVGGVMELDSGNGDTTLNILKTTELYTLKGRILWYVI